MSKEPKESISPAELRILDALWEKSPLTAFAIVEAVTKIEAWHSRTIKTLIMRLVKKNIVGYQVEKNHYLYFPLIKKTEYQKKISKNLIERVFGGRLSPLVAHFAKQEKLQQDDIQELKKILAELDNNDK